MLALLFTIACLLGLVTRLRQAGWSFRRADRRGVYWCLVGAALGLVVTLRPMLSTPLLGLAAGPLAAALFYGLVADWRGWWRRDRV
jgi:hypothetical protein